MAATRAELRGLLGSSLPIDAALRATAVEALAAIDAVPAGGCIATDCDGTTWAGDVGDELVRLAEAHPRLFPGSKVDFLRYLEEMERDYVAGCLASAALCRTPALSEVRVALADWIRARIVPRRWLVDALADAAARGVRVLAVSASARPAVEVGLRHIGLADGGAAALEVIAVDPLAHGFSAPTPIGEGKVAALHAYGVERVDVALGDSRWDGPMLAFAERGLLLTPGAYAEDLGWDREAARGGGSTT